MKEPGFSGHLNKDEVGFKDFIFALNLIPAIFLKNAEPKLFGTEMLNTDNCYNLASAYSSILAFCLGSYAYKKLTQSNKNAVKTS